MGVGSSKKNKEEINKNSKSPQYIRNLLDLSQKASRQYREEKEDIIRYIKEEIINYLNQKDLNLSKEKMDNILKAEDDIIIYDILNHILEILKEKLTCILSNNECLPELKTPLNSILYATTHLEIKELKDFREIIKQKYGTEFVNKADNNEEHLVNEVLVEKFKKNIYSEN